MAKKKSIQSLVVSKSDVAKVKIVGDGTASGSSVYVDGKVLPALALHLKIDPRRMDGIATLDVLVEEMDISFKFNRRSRVVKPHRIKRA